MKFTLLKDPRSDELMAPLLSGLLPFGIAFLISDLYSTAFSIGVRYDTVAATLFGNAEEYLDPLSEISLLEWLHGAVFFTMMTLLTFAAVYARLCAHRWRIAVVNVAMLAGLVALVSLPAAYYLHEAFIWVWLCAFWLWHTAGLFMALSAGYELLTS